MLAVMSGSTTVSSARFGLQLTRSCYLACRCVLQELGFVTATQRVLDEPLAMRFHYGHPDVFDKTTAITMGGISRPRHVCHCINITACTLLLTLN
jgi:1,3-beta-glucan synthase component